MRASRGAFPVMVKGMDDGAEVLVRKSLCKHNTQRLVFPHFSGSLLCLNMLTRATVPDSSWSFQTAGDSIQINTFGSQSDGRPSSKIWLLMGEPGPAVCFSKASFHEANRGGRCDPDSPTWRRY